MTADSDGALVGCAIYIPSKTSPTFSVDSYGNVRMMGNLTLKSGAISWSNLDSTIQDTVNGAYDAANDAYDEASDAYNAASSARTLARSIANGTYSNGTFIDGRSIYSPTIYADEFVVMPETRGSETGGYSIYGYYGNTLYKFFNLSYFGGNAPYIVFSSPDGAYVNWSFSWTYFRGNIDFSSANVYGLKSVATFG